GEYVDDLIEVGAVGPLGGSGHRHGADQSTETGGVPGVGDAEHAGADLDHVQWCAPLGLDHLLATGLLGLVGHVAGLLHLRTGGAAVGRAGLGRIAHASSPFISWVGSAVRAASSTLRTVSARFTPSGPPLMIWLCSSRIELISISGRGGQPGR